MGYKKDTLKGFTWLGAFRIATRGMSFVRTAILARLLLPSSFGLFGIVTIVLSITEVLTETGINIFLVQKKQAIDEYIDTAWVVSIARGFLIGAVIFISAPLVATFFKAGDSEGMLRLASLIPICRGFINPSVAKYIKDLQFNKEFIYRTSIFFVESVTSVIIVLISGSVYGLVIGLLAGAIFEIFLSFFYAQPRPHFVFVRERFYEVIHQGKWMTASGIFNYLYHNLDTVVVGRMLNTTALGLYDMTYKISSLPISEFTDVITRSTFPVYMKISEEKRRLKVAFFKTIGATALLVTPVALIFFFFPDRIILLILGEQWIASAPVLKVLALYGSLRAISGVTYVLFYSLQRQDVVTKVTFVSLISMLISIFFLIQPLGLVGAGIAALIGSVMAYPVIGYYVYMLLFKNEK